MHTEKLNHKQLRFIHEYLQDHNAAAAARRAGYSDSTRGSHAAALMNNPLIRARIDEEMAALFERLRVSAFRLLQAQSRAAFCDPRKLFGPDGRPVPLHELDEETAGALTVSYEDRPQGKVLRVKQSPRHLALAALAKRFDRFIAERAALTAAEEGDEDVMESPPEAADASEATDTARPVATAAPLITGLSERRPKGAPQSGKHTDWRKSGLLNHLFAAPPNATGEHARADNPRQTACG